MVTDGLKIMYICDCVRVYNPYPSRVKKRKDASQGVFGSGLKKPPPVGMSLVDVNSHCESGMVLVVSHGAESG